jgi:hypothetical protein
MSKEKIDKYNEGRVRWDSLPQKVKLQILAAPSSCIDVGTVEGNDWSKIGRIDKPLWYGNLAYRVRPGSEIDASYRSRVFSVDKHNEYKVEWRWLPKSIRIQIKASKRIQLYYNGRWIKWIHGCEGRKAAYRVKPGEE